MRGALLGPLAVAVLWIWKGTDFGVSAAVGIGMALINLGLAGRVIGGVAENRPQLLLAGAMIAFTLGLALLTGIGLALQATGFVTFKITGVALVVTHLGLVLWEAAGAYPATTNRSPATNALKARS
ncbi:MAG: hypothetical protein LC808_28945 [Actinobacteria bacterium]|nr:hypothetical protein [Actinomycetota bacterium]